MRRLRPPTLGLVACIAGACALRVAPALPLAAAASFPPSIDGVSSSNVTLSSALLSGYVDPRGVATSSYFEYGATAAYGAQTPPASVGAGDSEVKVSQLLSGLAAGTTYHFRLVAVSVAGKTDGADHAFTTARIPLSLQIAAIPSPVVFGGSLSIVGTLSGTGAAGREVELQVNPFPYSGMVAVGAPELTDAGGRFSFPVPTLPANARFRVVTVGSAVVSSPVIFEGVALRVVLHVRRVRHRHGFFRLYGTVSPADVGAHVGFQLIRRGAGSVNEGGAFVRRATATMSRFSRIVHIRHPGVYSALVESVNGFHIAGYSQPVRIR